MSGKTKAEPKVPVLKGQQAEDRVLEYVKRMNRPYGAVDVAANLKGAVPKAATQKILVSLAEKGELVQKTYGKTTFFVANQANIPTMSNEEIASLTEEHNTIEEADKILVAELRTATADLARLKATPTDTQLTAQITKTKLAIQKAEARLEPLRSGTPLVSEEELLRIDAEWSKWRAEWIRRKKIFNTLWQVVSDTITPQEAEDLAENLGIEMDTAEHTTLERGPLCVLNVQNSLKRKR